MTSDIIAYDYFPEELKTRKQWFVAHTHLTVDGKIDKAPRHLSGKLRRRGDSGHTFESAQRYANRVGCNFGFYLTEHDPYTVIDLDNHGDTIRDYSKIIRDFNSYCTVSLSGTGFHIWIRAIKPGGRSIERFSEMQVFSQDRFIICTGRAINVSEIEDRQDVLNRYFTATGVSESGDLVEYDAVMSIDEVLDKFSKFRKPYHLFHNAGSYTEYDWSRSEAEQCIINSLCRVTSCNAQIRDIMTLWADYDSTKHTVTHLNYAIRRARERYPAVAHEFHIDSYSDLCRNYDRPQWLVDGLWSRGGHGIVSALPKCYKSTVVTGMAVAIASGGTFLGRQARQGPVLIVQAENSRAHLGELMRSYGEMNRAYYPPSAKILGNTIRVVRGFPRDLPLHVIMVSDPRNPTFDLRESLDHLQTTIESIKPVLIIFDPVYQLIGGADTNSQAEMSPIFTQLTRLAYKHKCGLILVHHDSKAGSSHGGSGTVHFGSFFVCSWKIEKVNKSEIIINTAFREFPEGNPIRVQMHKNGKLWPQEIVDEPIPVAEDSTDNYPEGWTAIHSEIEELIEQGINTIHQIADRINKHFKTVERALNQMREMKPRQVNFKQKGTTKKWYLCRNRFGK